jgi:PAS domain S-box-containing protein
VLREYESRYRMLFESIDEGFCIIEMIFNQKGNPIDYRFLEVNPAFEKQTGLVDAQGKRMREMAPEHEEHWFEIYGRISLTGEPVRFQHRAEQLHCWYDVYAFPYGRLENRQVAILFNDITERKQAEKSLREAHDELETQVKERTFQLVSATKALEEEILERRKTARALRASEEKHRSLVERIPAVIYRASMKNNATQYVSPQIQEFLGYTQEEWLADPQLWWKRVHSEDKERVKSEFQQGKMEVKSFTCRYRILDRSGRIKWFRDDAIFSKDDEVFHGIMFDITSAKEIEQNLKRQREVLQSTFENIPVMLCFYDPEGRVSWVNQEMERLTGYSLKDFQEMEVMETLYPDPEYRKQVWEYMMQAEMGWQDFRVRTRYGSDLESSWSNVRLSDGSQIGIGIDITKRLENEAKLRYLSSRLLEAQETERRNVALELHDGLGGSLLGIKMTVERKLNDIRKGRTVSEGTTLEEILQLVRSCMRDSSRIQHNLRPSVLDHLGLAPALRSLCREFENAHDGIRTACTLQIDDLQVPEDLKITMYRICQEALTNIAKHSKAENVNLSLTHHNGEVELMVRDDGCGFDMEKAQQSGEIRSGVGLASMKERCEFSGGTLVVDSHEDEGTTIRATWHCVL